MWSAWSSGRRSGGCIGSSGCRSVRSAGGRGCIARRSGGRWRPRRRRGTSRAPAGSKLDPFKDWICEQLRADPTIPSLRLREMATELGYEGGKTIFDDYVREVRPRFVVRADVPAHDLSARRAGAVRSVGAARAGPGRARADAPRLGRDRGAVLVAGDRRRADLLQAGAGHPVGRWAAALSGSARCRRSWCGTARARSTPAAAARPTSSPRFCGQLGVGWVILDAGDAQAKGVLERSHRFMRTNFEPGRRFANPLDFQLQLDGWCDRVNERVHRTIRAVPAERLVEERARMRPLPAAMPDSDRRFVTRVPQQPYLRVDRNDYSIDPAFAGRRVEVRVSQTRGDRGRARHRRAGVPAPPRVRRRADVHRPRAPERARAASARGAASATRSTSRSGRWPATTS